MRVHFDENEEYNPYEQLPSSMQVETVPVKTTFNHLGNSNNNPLDDDWWAEGEPPKMQINNSENWSDKGGFISVRYLMMVLSVTKNGTLI